MQSKATRSSRVWVSPLAGVTFLVIGITGTLMLFHIELPGVTPLHEVAGVLFLILGVLHLKLNWSALLSCCRQRRGRVALIAGAALMGLLLVAGATHDKEHHRRGDGPPSHAGGFHR